MKIQDANNTLPKTDEIYKAIGYLASPNTCIFQARIKNDEAAIQSFEKRYPGQIYDIVDKKKGVGGMCSIKLLDKKNCPTSLAMIIKDDLITRQHFILSLINDYGFAFNQQDDAKQDSALIFSRIHYKQADYSFNQGYFHIYSLNQPDESLSVADMRRYGYKWDGMLPLSKDSAQRLEPYITLYKLHEDGSETAIDDMADLEAHNGIFGIEKKDLVCLLTHFQITPQKLCAKVEKHYAMVEKTEETQTKEEGFSLTLYDHSFHYLNTYHIPIDENDKYFRDPYNIIRNVWRLEDEWNISKNPVIKLIPEHIFNKLLAEHSISQTLQELEAEEEEIEACL